MKTKKESSISSFLFNVGDKVTAQGFDGIFIIVAKVGDSCYWLSNIEPSSYGMLFANRSIIKAVRR